MGRSNKSRKMLLSWQHAPHLLHAQFAPMLLVKQGSQAWLLGMLSAAQSMTERTYRTAHAALLFLLCLQLMHKHQHIGLIWHQFYVWGVCDWGVCDW